VSRALPEFANDVTPSFADRDEFIQLVEELARPFLDADIDAAAAIGVLGFILGTAIAEVLGVGLLR
jgi:adenine/guanine phosphoribosyltransferase-like PRPP-binding protein